MLVRKPWVLGSCWNAAIALGAQHRPMSLGPCFRAKQAKVQYPLGSSQAPALACLTCPICPICPICPGNWARNAGDSATVMIYIPYTGLACSGVSGWCGRCVARHPTPLPFLPFRGASIGHVSFRTSQGVPAPAREPQSLSKPRPVGNALSVSSSRPPSRRGQLTTVICMQSATSRRPDSGRMSLFGTHLGIVIVVVDSCQQVTDLHVADGTHKAAF